MRQRLSNSKIKAQSSLQDVFIAKQKKDFIKQLQAEAEADKINVLVANLLASKPVGRPLKNAPAAVVLQSSAVLGLQREPPKKQKKPQIKSKPRKWSKKIRNEMASKSSPLLKFGFKKIKKS